MKIYFVAKENGTYICSPFRKIEQAKEAQENYTQSHFYGNPIIKEKEYKEGGFVKC